MWPLKPIKTKNVRDRQDFLACRVCLATGVVLYNIHDNNLTEEYMQITGISLEDCLPQQLCCYCAALLLKCIAFKEKARTAYNLLLDISNSGKSITVKNIKDVQKNHKELLMPYSFSETMTQEIFHQVEVPIVEQLPTKDLTKVEPQYANDAVKEEVKNESVDKNDLDYNNDDDDDKMYDDGMDDDDTDDDDVDTKEKTDENVDTNEEGDLDMTIGELIDAKEEQFEKVVDKWMKGEYRIENLFDDADASIAEIRVLDRMPTWHEQHKLTDKDFIAMAKAFDFNAVFPNKEEQIREVEEMKQRRGQICRLCGMSFKNSFLLRKHSKNVHDPTAKYICNICSARFHAIYRFKYHRIQHRVTYYCLQCDYRTKDRLRMPAHQLKHKNNKFMCEACGKSFLSMGAVQKHERHWHMSSKPWCDLCGIAVMNSRGLNAHLRKVHKKIEVCTCECGAEFLSDLALKKHIKVGCGEWGCKHCGYALGSEYLLKLHILLQHLVPAQMNGALTFDCGHCLVSFHSTKGLDNHHRTCGSGVHCAQCGENYPDGKALEAHAKEHDAIGLTCGECGEQCKSVFSFQQHYYKLHKDEYLKEPVPRKRKPREEGAPRVRGDKFALKYFRNHTAKIWSVVDGKVVARTPDGETLGARERRDYICHVCGKTYKHPSHLRMHLGIHTGENMHKCEQCNKQFGSAHSLKMHMRSHNMPIQCPKCPTKLRSSLYKHMLTHSQERRHVCDLCGKSFKISSYVKLHIRTVHMGEKLPPRERRRKKVKEERKIEEDMDSEENEEITEAYLSYDEDSESYLELEEVYEEE